jgi:outer membrane lipoprotein-sorting protein
MGVLRMPVNRRAAVAVVFGVILSPLLSPCAALAVEGKSVAAADAAGGKAQSAKGAPAARMAPAAKTAPAAAAWPAHVPHLTATQIVDKYVAARGGAQAWKAVQSLQMSGKVEAGKGDSVERSMALFKDDKRFRGKPVGVTPVAGKDEAEAKPEAKAQDEQVQLPFTLDVKRPHKSRLEIQFAGKTAVQVYDGQHGWKLRPFLNRTDAEPFTAAEIKVEAANSNLEGPLFDYAAKGTKVSLEGVDPVQGSDAYKLKLAMKDGTTRYVWIDAKTFLDVKVQGSPRFMDRRMHDVFLLQRDFRKVDGVTLPFVVETSVDGYPDTHKMMIENVAVNPKLDDGLFTKPHV